MPPENIFEETLLSTGGLLELVDTLIRCGDTVATQPEESGLACLWKAVAVSLGTTSWGMWGFALLNHPSTRFQSDETCSFATVPLE